MTRPALDPQISAETFLRYYWLTNELAAFCRSCGLPANGSKQMLTQRIAKYLETGLKMIERDSVPGKSASRSRMPLAFTRSTIIGPGWRCSQALRTFFEQEIGRSFHFNATMRDFIHNGQGKTLQEAILAWEAARRSPGKKQIAPQFEYNQHVRDYLEANPGAGLQAAIRTWHERKQNPKE